MIEKLQALRRLYRTQPAEFRRIVRYLAVGGWNTVFGVGIYALLYEMLGDRVHYLLLQAPAFVLSVTNAYICYKLLVFQTRGNILREYLKCYIVYGGSALLNTGLLFLLVKTSGWNPSLGNAATTFVTVVISYLGHRFFSFKESGKEKNEPKL